MIFGGGATGLLGTVFSRIFNFVDRKAERQFILEKYKLDAEIRSKEIENEQSISQAKNYSDMQVASYAHDSGSGQASQWVVNTIRLVRPVLTLLLWLLVGLIWLSIMNDTDKIDLPWLAHSAMALKEQIIGSILYSATASTLWWFGTRDMRKAK